MLSLLTRCHFDPECQLRNHEFLEWTCRFWTLNLSAFCSQLLHTNSVYQLTKLQHVICGLQLQCIYWQLLTAYRDVLAASLYSDIQYQSIFMLFI